MPRLLVEIIVPGSARWVPLVRHTVKHAITMAGHPNTDGTCQVLAELVNNAVVHSRSGRTGGLIDVEVSDIGDMLVRIEVTDEGALTIPRPRTPMEDDGNGRGLLLVGEISERWGFRRNPWGGNIVWADVRTCTDTPPTVVAAPPPLRPTEP